MTMPANQAKPTPGLYVGGELYVKATAHQALLEALKELLDEFKMASGWGVGLAKSVVTKAEAAISLAEKGQP